MKLGDLIEVPERDRKFLAKVVDLRLRDVGYAEVRYPFSTGHTQYYNVKKVKNLYERLLEEYEEYPSDKMYKLKKDRNFTNDLIDDCFEEITDEKYRKYNLMGMELSWILEGVKMANRFLPRKKAKKLNLRITRYYKNLFRRLK